MRAAPIRPLAFAAALAAAWPAMAGEADVLAATARPAGDDTWTITATIKHADTGWEHYADGFEIVGPDGAVLGVRTLFHPHVNEQPFTRSLAGVRIPADVTAVQVRAKDKVHGFGGAVVTIELAR